LLCYLLRYFIIILLFLSLLFYSIAMQPGTSISVGIIKVPSSSYPERESITSSEQPIMQHPSPPQFQPKPRWDPNPWLQRQDKAAPQCQSKPRWNSNPRLQHQPIPRWDSNSRLLPQKEVLAIGRPVIHNAIIITGNTIMARPKNPTIPEAARVKRLPGPVPLSPSPLL